MDLRGGDESTLVSLRLKPFLSATWWYETICVSLGGLGGGASVCVLCVYVEGRRKGGNSIFCFLLIYSRAASVYI